MPTDRPTLSHESHDIVMTWFKLADEKIPDGYVCTFCGCDDVCPESKEPCPANKLYFNVLNRIIRGTHEPRD